MITFKSHADKFIDREVLTQNTETTRNLISKLKQDPMAGWLDLPISYDKQEFSRIKQAAQKIQKDSKYLVCIGIGGSYLGHKAVIEALEPITSPTKILYAGNSLSPLELDKVLQELGDQDFSINVISKSGTTLEPAIAFRIFKQKLIAKYGEQAVSSRIYATTDANKGAPHDEAKANHYEMFVVPDNIGGRYSVLTAVGLLPLAAAGVNIDELIDGAEEERAALISDGGIAADYAALRNTLYAQDFNIEILATFEPALAYFNEWWKQLFGESEGKSGQGIYPASVIYSTDLHSMGQYIQEGRRNLFETFIKIQQPTGTIAVPTATTNQDGLAYLEGKTLSYINDQAQQATREAHLTGGVPIIEITIPNLSPRSLGALIYFFETTVALSSYLQGTNPFDQPGVEAYKTNMLRLLSKPAQS